MTEALKKSLIVSAASFICLVLPVFSADLKVGVAWDAKSGMADQVCKGFVEAMRTLAPQVDVEIQKELKDVAALGEVVKRFEKEKSAIVLLRSSGAKYLGQNPPAVPGFFGACTDPVELGVIKSAAAPEGKITGVTYSIPYKTQFETFLNLVPKAKSVLLLVQAGHPSSALNQAGTKAACEQFKLQYTEKVCQTKEEALAAAKEADGKVSLIVLGAQALLIDEGGAIASTLKTPVVSYTEKPVPAGALGGLVADDFKLGGLLAESVVAVLVKGKTIKDVPVKVDPQPQLVINAETAARLGLEISFEVLRAAKVIQKTVAESK